MMESTERYKRLSQLPTNKGINAPTAVIAGRTLGECIFTFFTFIACAFFNHPFLGLVLAFFIFSWAITLREAYPKCTIQHVLYGLGFFSKKSQGSHSARLLEKFGLATKNEYSPNAYFTFKHKICIRRV